MGIDAPQGNALGRAGGLEPLSIGPKVRKAVFSVARFSFGQQRNSVWYHRYDTTYRFFLCDKSERFSSACSLRDSCLSTSLACVIVFVHASLSTVLSFASWRAHVAVTRWVC